MSEWPAFVVFLLAAVIWFVHLVRRQVRIDRKCREWQEWWDRNRPSLLQIESARSLYGEKWEEGLRECIDAHMPGDFPICGAV